MALNQLKYINDLNPKQIERRVSQWRKLAKARTSIKHLSVKVGSLCKHVPFQTIKTLDQSKYFRGREARDANYFSNVSELWYPPAQSIKRLGRANQKKSPMLYVSQDGRTALFELGLGVGAHVAIAEISTKNANSLHLQVVGIFNDLLKTNLGALEDTQPESFRELGCDDNGIANMKTIHRLIGEEFMREVSPNSTKDYAVSVAVANFLLSYDPADGLVYPSKRSPNDYNVVIKPQRADLKLFVKRVYGLKVEGAENGQVKFRYVKASDAISSDGEINWNEGPDLPTLDWNSAGFPALQGPFKE